MRCGFLVAVSALVACGPYTDLPLREPDRPAVVTFRSRWSPPQHPSYSFQIFASGLVEYQGVLFVDVMGYRWRQLRDSELERVLTHVRTLCETEPPVDGSVTHAIEVKVHAPALGCDPERTLQPIVEPSFGPWIERFIELLDASSLVSNPT